MDLLKLGLSGYKMLKKIGLSSEATKNDIDFVKYNGSDFQVWTKHIASMYLIDFIKENLDAVKNVLTTAQGEDVLKLQGEIKALNSILKKLEVLEKLAVKNNKEA